MVERLEGKGRFAEAPIEDKQRHVRAEIDRVVGDRDSAKAPQDERLPDSFFEQRPGGGGASSMLDSTLITSSSQGRWAPGSVLSW